jgi:hypothetical protein
MRAPLARVLLCCGLLAAAPAAAQGVLKSCVPLAAEDAAKVRSIRVTSAIPQDDVQKMTLPLIQAHVQAPAGAGFGGGLILSVVASVVVTAAINADVRRRIEQATLAFPPLLEEVKDFDFRRQFWTRLARGLERGSRFRILDITTFDSERGYLDQAETVGGEPVDAMLELRTEYALAPDLRSFMMVTDALLQSRADNRELYRCRYTFSTPPVSEGDYAAAIAVWAADQGALYRAAALMGIQQTLKMLRYDLTDEAPPAPAVGEGHAHDLIAGPAGPVRIAVKGTLIERDAGAVIVRDANGLLRSSAEGQAFAPPQEVVAAASSGPPPASPSLDRRSMGPIGLDDLLGVMEDAPAAASRAKTPEAPPAVKKTETPPSATKAAGGVGIDDLDGLLGK